MKTILVREAFDAYPNGKKRSFAAGDEVEVSDADADLYVAKGHARLQEPKDEPAREQPTEKVKKENRS